VQQKLLPSRISYRHCYHFQQPAILSPIVNYFKAPTSHWSSPPDCKRDPILGFGVILPTKYKNFDRAGVTALGIRDLICYQ